MKHPSLHCGEGEEKEVRFNKEHGMGDLSSFYLFLFYFLFCLSLKSAASVEMYGLLLFHIASMDVNLTCRTFCVILAIF